MPRYDAKRIEPRWQRYWEEHQTFMTPETARGEKLYVLDMFPYPSGEGLHVGHPEGYTATDIVCRYSRMRGKHVLHPMGWDAFGLPAEQHAKKTGTHPRETTERNIATFRRQLKMLGFSYDWGREFSTTDPDYFRWTQWIFLQIFDSWYDPNCQWTGPDGRPREGRGRPISELPIPDQVREQGAEAVRRYQDKHRLAYQQEAPVNWCPALGTVLANEEVQDGRSERGNHPVVRIPLRQWMLRITAYGDRLLEDLDEVQWPESVKALQRNWIGRSVGAEVDFYIGPPDQTPPRSRDTAHERDLAHEYNLWHMRRRDAGFPEEPTPDVVRVYTTRPDTLYGATYMVIAPEHPYVERLTAPEQTEAVQAYCRRAATKSDLDRTDLAKEKTGVFTGSYAFNPVAGKEIPIWVADYVLISYGTGAIMAVPAHDLRDWEFAVKYDLSIIPVVRPPEGYEPTKEERALALSPPLDKGGPGGVTSSASQAPAPSTDQDSPRSTSGGAPRTTPPNPPLSRGGAEDRPLVPFSGEGTAINSGEENDGLPTAEFKEKITADLHALGLGRRAVNFRLRDWLFSRQHFWGEPFPIWHELDAGGNPTGLLRTDAETALPVRLPENFQFKGHGSAVDTKSPEPPLAAAPDDWLYRTDADGTRLKRETNTMPQWAGSCWYYIRFCDPKNETRFVDPAKEKYWLPVDLYIGGAEHAVLHLLYSRFWHKILFDRGHVTTSEPFRRLVNQGMILGEMEFTGYQTGALEWVSAKQVEEHAGDANRGGREWVNRATREKVAQVKLTADMVEKQGDEFVLKADPSVVIESRAFKMSKSRGNVINPDKVVDEYGADALRMYEMFMGPLEQAKPWSMAGVEGVYRFLGRVWRMIVDERADDVRLSAAVQDVPATAEQERVLHRTIKAVTDDIEKLSFNTAISRMMEFTNAVSTQEPRPKSILEPFVLLLSPFAPHIAEELWHLLGHADSLAYAPWPAFDESKIAESEIELPVQVNGKLRAKIRVPADADQPTAQRLAESAPEVQPHLAGKQIVKVVVVPGRMVNFVVKG